MPDRCKGTNARGEPCASPFVGPDGWCRTHDPGAREEVAEWRGKGGAATALKWASPGFDPEELTALENLEDAKRALDQIRRAILTRRISHAEGNAASKAVAEWVRAEAAAETQRLVNELRGELEAKERELKALRAKLPRAA